MPLLEQLTLALVAAGGVGACDNDPWLHECTEMMLEVWTGERVWMREVEEKEGGGPPFCSERGTQTLAFLHISAVTP